MTRIKVSATVELAHLERAKALTACNSVSAVLDRGLEALIEDQLERIHAEAYARLPQGGDSLQAVDAVVWVDLPWHDE